jgi:glyoxylase-like metal-dependent hydrolase (beta-lactamase superfamily II)
MKINTFVFNPFYENTIVVSSDSGNALIFDPGCYEIYEIEELTDFVRLNDLTVKGIINTHCHIDHVLGNFAIKQKYGTRLSIPVNEKEMFDAVAAYSLQWGITNYQAAQVDEYITEGTAIVLDELSFQTIEVPGHSPGHLMFYESDQQVIIGGDVLFRESIGRTDLPGGDHEALISNIQNKVYTLPEEVEVYPGHGPVTTIGYEKNHNPFVKG